MFSQQKHQYFQITFYKTIKCNIPQYIWGKKSFITKNSCVIIQRAKNNGLSLNLQIPYTIICSTLCQHKCTYVFV